jgi:HK97 gp10 family phage protein
LADNLGTISLPGIEDLIADLEKYNEKIQTEVAYEIEASARTIVRNAKRNAPKDQGRIAQLISYKTLNKLTQELISGAEYSAFPEFGTKSKVRISNPELAPLAQQFKGVKLARGKMGFRQAIYEWAKRKGISKDAWYPIFISILRFGIRAQPYFFPAYYAEIPLLRKRLENILNKTQP